METPQDTRLTRSDCTCRPFSARAAPQSRPTGSPRRGGGQLSWGPSQTCATKPPLTTPDSWFQAQQTFCWLVNARMRTYRVFKENKSTRPTIFLCSRKCIAVNDGNSRTRTCQTLDTPLFNTTLRHRDAPVTGTAQEPDYILPCQVLYYPWLHSSSSLPLHIPPTHHKHGKQSPGISLNRALSGEDKAIGPDSRLHESERCQSLKVLWQKASSA